MDITFYGHSCFLIDLDGIKILFDPFITPNPIAKDVNIDDIKPHFILLSHGHEDHVADVERIYEQSNAKIIANYEVIQWFNNKGLHNNHPVNHGGKIKLTEGISAKYVNAVHSSCMPDGSYGGNPGGWVIEHPKGSFYYSGDTALTLDMKLIGELHKIDFAFLCLGDNFTMGVEDSALAAEFVKTKDVIGMHFDSFGFIEINHDFAINHYQKKGLNLSLLNINETIQK